MEANKKKILVVDDEQDLCEILKFNLETEGYQADTANSGEEARSMDIASDDGRNERISAGKTVEGESDDSSCAYHLPDSP